MNILISPLGLAPGVVTGAYYALRDGGYGDMDSIITISTTSDLTRLCEREIEAELERARRELGVTIRYQERHAIPSDEVRGIADVYRFRKIVLDLLRTNLDAGHKVYLSLTGGRKSMVAAAAMAAQYRNPTKTFYVYVDEEIEREGNVAILIRKPTSKRRFYLKPPAGKIGLVEIPLLSLDEKGMDPTPWQSRIFEFAVGAYLTTQLATPYTQIEYKFYPDYLHGEGLGEVDIRAVRPIDGDSKILLCECKLRIVDEPDSEPVTVEEIEKLGRKKRKVIEQESPDDAERVKAWIVSNAGTVEDVGKAAKYGIELYQARLSPNWRNRADWEVDSMQPIK